MTPDGAKQVTAIVRYLATAYQQRWDEETVEYWIDALSDLSRVDWLREAARDMVRGHEGIPTVAKLRTYYESARSRHRFDRGAGGPPRITDPRDRPLPKGEAHAGRGRAVIEMLRQRTLERARTAEDRRHRRRTP